METVQGFVEATQDLVTSHPYWASVVAGIPTVFVAKHLLFGKRKPKIVDAPPDTVVHYQIPRGPYAPSMSPYPLKLETYLRLAGIKHKNVFGMTMSSKGKTPWISLNEEVVCDSQFIMEFLNKRMGVDLNKGLNQQERAVAHALQVMIDEHLYWAFVYFRWVESLDSRIISIAFSWITRRIFGRFLTNQLHGQGMGRHSKEEITSILHQDLQALTDQLGNKRFLMGDDITEVDCSAFGMLTQMIYHYEDNTMNVVQKRYPSLLQYHDRIKSQVWPDWDECHTNGGTKMPTK